jgi:hypothetical protein
MIDGIDPHWFWLVFGVNDCLCATLQSLDKGSRAAILTCDVRDEPKVVERRSLILARAGKRTTSGWSSTPLVVGRKNDFRELMRSPRTTTRVRRQSLEAAS